MELNNPEFIVSAHSLKQLPDSTLPEIAFAGRSNAGKSSAINSLTGNKQLARTSKTPGRTQLLNFFALSENQRLVDLPVRRVVEQDAVRLLAVASAAPGLGDDLGDQADRVAHHRPSGFGHQAHRFPEQLAEPGVDEGAGGGDVDVLVAVAHRETAADVHRFQLDAGGRGLVEDAAGGLQGLQVALRLQALAAHVEGDAAGFQPGVAGGPEQCHRLFGPGAEFLAQVGHGPLVGDDDAQVGVGAGSVTSQLGDLGRVVEREVVQADAVGVGECECSGFPGRVVVHRDQRGDTAPCDVLPPHEVAGALGGDHDHVDARRGLDAPEADVEEAAAAAIAAVQNPAGT